MLDKFKEIFGSMSKWVLLALICIAVVVGVVLFIFVIKNIKWVLLGIAIALVLGVGGYFLYRYLKNKPKEEPKEESKEEPAQE